MLTGRLFASLLRRTRADLSSFAQQESGVSAIEFALFGPIFIFSLLAMVDVGIAAFQRMTIDHVLRAGAASAMVDAGPATIQQILELTAAQNFTGANSTSGGSAPALSLSVQRYCICPNMPNAKVSCSTICTGSVPTLAYYSLSAAKSYSGMLLPTMNFNPELQVQVR